MTKPAIGTIGWIDLTVGDAARIRDFYAEVVGWRPDPVPMDGYDDFNMGLPSTGEAVAGVCHARGTNADLPPRWMLYIVVADVDESASKCVELGGKLLVPTKAMGSYGRYCVIEDPAGAVAALFESSG